ncbi:hypothetical protein, partial [Klebsiella aerogenes]|uniref:hypothetical protein n=1 Tax=Klebsiella aerogenes TaxID=548 RepID=UPI001953CAD5
QTMSSIALAMGSGNKDELIVEQETYLVDFLPQTLQTLTIFFDRWARYELLHFITYLGERLE